MARACWIVPACLVTVVLLASCGGGDDAEPGVGAEDRALAATLTNDACRYTGPESVPSGALSIDVENRSGGGAVFELVRLAEGASVNQLAGYVDEQQRRIADGKAPAGRPSFLSVAERLPVRMRWSSSLAVDAVDGTYAVLCTIGPPPTAVFLATTLEAGE